ncbi:MAG: IS66 family transposase [Prevotella sp.]|nr:IS66 family transposase [Prevotella sp.]MBR0273662.1 IS66 family transposase [Bacteroidaceae bacterium]
MIAALQDIDSIIKAVAVERLRREGGIDGRTARSIASQILKASGERYLRMEQTLADREETIAEKDGTIASLLATMDAKDRRIAELEGELARYKEYFGKTARPQATSTNSSLPPSKNPLSVPRTRSQRKPTGRKPGGQEGHEGHTHLFSENPDSVEVCPMPHVCPICGEPLDPTGLQVAECRQVIDLPLPILFNVVEWVQHKVKCKCGHTVKGIFPDHVRGTVCYGENVQALVAYLSTLQTIPMKRMTDVLNEVFGLGMSPGTVANTLDYMRKKARKPYEEIRKAIEQSDVAGADETGMHVNGKNHWMWTFQTAAVTYLAAYKGRGKAEIDDIFPGGLPKTILVTDRLKAYFNMNVKDHQICLAHLLRNTIFFEELLPEHDWPKRMLQLLRESIHRRKTQHTDIGDEEEFKRRFDELIDESVSIGDEEYQKLFDTFRKGLSMHREHIFLFLSHHAVPYDNNASERAVRPVKTKLKVSGQFRSDDGAKNYATLMSIALTAKKNGRNPFFAFQKLAEYYEGQ